MDRMAEAYLLKSTHLTASISRRGGEIRSLQYGDTELIWQGDPAYWAGSAPFLFPFCGRVKGGVYTWQNKDYSMPIHGFLPEAVLSVASVQKDALTLTLADTPETRAIYPFSFNLRLCYRLTEDALTVTATVTAGDTGLPFSFGAHPGFNLPFFASGFGDARLCFDRSNALTRIEIAENGLLGSGRTAYPLDEHTLPLSPDPAGGCGVFFEIPKEQRAVTLIASALPCDLRVEFPDFPVLGLWHAEDAPYLCIEPWHGLPAPDGVPTDLADKPATVFLSPHQSHTFELIVLFQQKGSHHV